MSKRGGRPTGTSRASWPKRARLRKRHATWTRWSHRPRSRSVRLKKKAPRDRPPPGRLGDHGDDFVLFAAGTWWQRAWPRRQWTLPRVGGLSDERRKQPNVQAEVGRLVGLLPIAAARAE